VGLASSLSGFNRYASYPSAYYGTEAYWATRTEASAAAS
jgi:hypothetical protein